MRSSSAPAKSTLSPAFSFPMSATPSSQNLGLILDSVLSLYPNPHYFFSTLLKHLSLSLLTSNFLFQSIPPKLDVPMKIQILKRSLSLF